MQSFDPTGSNLHRHPTKAVVPQLVTTISDLRSAVAALKPARVALVPTMGALHEGHLRLISEARAHCDHVVVSIFVNPVQFAPHEDFHAYPRDLNADLAKLGDRCALVFAPGEQEIYPPGHATRIEIAGPAQDLESEFRPHFFSGVALVVAKLLIMTHYDAAVFGEKDYQQLLVIRQLARDLSISTSIIGAPTVREKDGLALSSRNAYLTRAQREVAASLNQVLKKAIANAKNGDLRAAETRASQALIHDGFDRVDYVAIRDARTLAKIDILAGPARILAAAWIGRTRLIDNMAV